MYFYDGVWREIGEQAVYAVFFCIVIGAEVWHHRKDIRKNADEAAKKRLKRRFHGRLILYALGICIFLGYGAYLWDGIKTEDIGSFVGIEEMEE